MNVNTRPHQAHPRVCGENATTASTGITLVGSSPRVRGKRAVGVLDGDVDRLIPACAGKTGRRAVEAERFRAHPRVCGENLLGFDVVTSAWGSSPRVRGKPALSEGGGSSVGLIPACAGKTRRSPSVARGAWAHPRVCGENQLGKLPEGAQYGSSPRVRGKLCWRGWFGLFFGLIPACAGKTRPRSS